MEHWLTQSHLFLSRLPHSCAELPLASLIHAEWDVDVTFDTTRDFFSRLTAAPYRRWIEIGQGTHMVILEKNRWQVVDSIIEFLREDAAAAVDT
jgi:hypothetical protein